MTANDTDEIFEDVPTEVNDSELQELALPRDVVAATRQAWEEFLGLYDSGVACGEAIYAAIFDSSPSLQSLFKIPRAIMAVRFLQGLTMLIKDADSKEALRSSVGMLGFRHLELAISQQRVGTFRDAIIDLLDAELEGFTAKARYGLARLINHAGAACIYVAREYVSRVELIHSTWQTACAKKETDMARTSSPDEEAPADERRPTSPTSASASNVQLEKEDNEDNEVPTTFQGLFEFNTAIMGFATSKPWMDLILHQLHDIAMNVANTGRLREECEKLALVLAKHEPIPFADFRAVAMASLKSFVPTWGEEHEIAWDWLWDNVGKMLKEMEGKTQKQEAVWAEFLASSPKEVLEELRTTLHQHLFEIAPASQEYFKQSKTRMYYIADRTLELSLTMYRNPTEAFEQVPIIGLRHVGMSIPLEFFSPFVTAAVDALAKVTKDEAVLDAYRWSMLLVGRILTRTVEEGSTLVMKAINLDSAAAVRQAMSVAPRKERAFQLLNVSVGTHAVSPLLWAIENACMVAARAMIQDLLTIRADRNVYYYGCDELFGQHPDIIRLLINSAPTLLPTLLDGLIWRSKFTCGGMRRVNYFVKHLIQDSEGHFNQALKWVARSMDTQLVRHPTLELVADTIWTGVAARVFILDRSIYLFFLTLFIISQCLLQHLDEGFPDTPTRVVIFSCRVIIYLGAIVQLLVNQIWLFRRDLQEGNFVLVGRLRLPASWQKSDAACQFALLWSLVLMCIFDPIFWCLGDVSNFKGAGLFTQSCPRAEPLKGIYSIASMAGALLYWLILSDLSLLSTRISAFRLLCGQLLGELCLYMTALAFLILTFASSLSALDHDSLPFRGIFRAALSLWELSLGVISRGQLEGVREDPVLFLGLAVFATLALTFLLSLLVAQLSEACELRYDEMLGFAWLQRCDSVVALVQALPARKWAEFRDSLQLEERLEFNEGDVGLPGGLQVLEPGNLHPTTEDGIWRFGGSAAGSMPWPEEKDEGEGDPFENLERQILQAVKETSRVTRKAQLNRSKSGISGAGSSIPSSIPTSTTQSSKVSTGGSVSISLDD